MKNIHTLKRLYERAVSWLTKPPKSSQAEESYLSVIRSLASAIDARNRFARTHTLNVEVISIAIGKSMGLSDQDLSALRIAALLHDAGKLGVPRYVLLKPGRLDESEYSKMRVHPIIGEKMLEGVEFPWPVSPIIRSHHERWDGKGYPDNLEGDKIPLGARILSAADVFDALISARSFREAKTCQEALDYIKYESGAKFDPDVAAALAKVIEGGTLGSPVPGINTEVSVRDSDHEMNTGNATDYISNTGSEFMAMFEIAQVTGASLNLDEILTGVASKIRKVIPCSMCAILVYDKEANELEVRMANGFEAACHVGVRTNAGSRLTGMAVACGEGIIAGYDPEDLPLGCDCTEQNKFKSAAIVPMYYDGALVGTINLYDEKEDAFFTQDIHTLKALAGQLSKAVYNSLLFEQTRESAMTDVLTGLPNARYLFNTLEEQMNKTRNSENPMSVLCLDLDGFKAVNDTLGHLCGDMVLKETGEILISQVRERDIVCRYAGDEFVIVLPNTGKAEAAELARRIQKTMSDKRDWKGIDKKIDVGISIGAAAYPEDGSTIRSLIGAADRSMYSDKRMRQTSRRPHAA